MHVSIPYRQSSNTSKNLQMLFYVQCFNSLQVVQQPSAAGSFSVALGPFQFLIGSLATPQPCYSWISSRKFQFLIGSLATIGFLQSISLMSSFNSLQVVQQRRPTKLNYKVQEKSFNSLQVVQQHKAYEDKEVEKIGFNSLQVVQQQKRSGRGGVEKKKVSIPYRQSSNVLASLVALYLQVGFNSLQVVQQRLGIK